jgi:hypothetical protein
MVPTSRVRRCDPAACKTREERIRSLLELSLYEEAVNEAPIQQASLGAFKLVKKLSGRQNSRHNAGDPSFVTDRRRNYLAITVTRTFFNSPRSLSHCLTLSVNFSVVPLGLVGQP